MRIIDPTILLAAMATLPPLSPPPARGPARLLARAQRVKFAPLTPAAVAVACA